MKKKLLLLLIILLCATTAFAKGRHKIGGTIGYNIGFSYGYEFTEFVELDLMLGVNPNGLYFAAAPLFTVYDPIVDGQHCPLSIGPAIGYGLHFNSGYNYSWDSTVGHYFEIAAPLRWEVFFKDAPKFNFFMEFGPGLAIDFHGTGKLTTTAHIKFAPRGGIGLRAIL